MVGIGRFCSYSNYYSIYCGKLFMFYLPPIGRSARLPMEDSLVITLALALGIENSYS